MSSVSCVSSDDPSRGHAKIRQSAQRSVPALSTFESPVRETCGNRSECADRQGRFSQFVHGVYTHQDSLGFKSWGSYAADACVLDTTAFLACTRTATFARIDSGLTFGRRIDLLGTPTIIVNGWQFPSPPQPELLSRVIDEVMAGRDPRSVYDANR